MGLTRSKRSLVLLLLTFSAWPGLAQLAIPELQGKRVHDEAFALSPSTATALEKRLKDFEDSTSTQIAVLIIPSLEGEVLEDYSLRVAEAWQLGQQKEDNGALLLVVVNDRKMRIETGYGLEGALPDILCNQIIRNEIAPNFRRADMDAGVTAGVTAMMQAVAGEYIAANNGDFAFMSGKELALVSTFVFTILGIFTFLGLASQGRMSWFLYAFLIPFYALFPGALFGWTTGLIILVTYLVGFVLLKLLVFKNRSWIKWQGSGGRWSSGRGWSGGGGWSSGGSGWSSGGGFSGGGGSFGGGGSSGSW